MIEANAAGLGSAAATSASRALTDNETYSAEGAKKLATGMITDYAVGFGTGAAFTTLMRAPLPRCRRSRFAGPRARPPINSARELRRPKWSPTRTAWPAI